MIRVVHKCRVQEANSYHSISLNQLLTKNRTPFTAFTILVSLTLIACCQSYAHGLTPVKGIVGQVVGNEKAQFYVRHVNITEHDRSGIQHSATEETGLKIVDVSVIFKNINSGQQPFDPNDIRLVDSESREYLPDTGPFFSINLPPNDILSWNAEFKIPPTSNVSKIYFTPYARTIYEDTRLTIDLTKSKNPGENPPTSSWILSSNKGNKMNNGQLEITTNDERYFGKTYVIDVTIKNIGNTPIRYGPSYFYVKNAEGFAYEYDSFSKLLNLHSGILPPGEIVRGDIAFDVGGSGPSMMIIFDQPLDNQFLNSGSQNAR